MTDTFDLVIADATVHLPAGRKIDGWLAVKNDRVAAVGSGPPPDAVDAGPQATSSLLTAVPAPQLNGSDASAGVTESAVPSAIAEPAMRSFIRM